MCDFRRGPKLDGSDPRETDAWHRNRIREAIGTAAWAYRVGDEPFEAQAHRIIAEALSASRPD